MTHLGLVREGTTNRPPCSPRETTITAHGSSLRRSHSLCLPTHASSKGKSSGPKKSAPTLFTSNPTSFRSTSTSKSQRPGWNRARCVARAGGFGQLTQYPRSKMSCPTLRSASNPMASDAAKLSVRVPIIDCGSAARRTGCELTAASVASVGHGHRSSERNRYLLGLKQTDPFFP
jgi:hypothetical protein